MKATILGTGTSTGVPIPGCRCPVCSSDNEKNKRLRCSVLLEYSGPDDQIFSVLIDTSTDLRLQALRAGTSKIDAVLYTHTHADHVHGIDDLRSFNFINKSDIAVYASSDSADELESKFRYCFYKDPAYEGGAPPSLKLHRIDVKKELTIGSQQITPLPVMHGQLEVLGYRLGSFAYITDCSKIPDTTRQLLKGVEVIVLDGLRLRPHKTHFNMEQAVAEIGEIAPKKAYLTHISHELEHEQANKMLSGMSSIPIELAYDGLEIILGD